METTTARALVNTARKCMKAVERQAGEIEGWLEPDAAVIDPPTTLANPGREGPARAWRRHGMMP